MGANQTLKKDVFESSIIDIHSKGAFPSNVLSNFHKSKFELDGIKINSMEGFLQSLKTPDQKLQKKICKMVGKDAKIAGTTLKETGFDGKTLHWNGKTLDRFSEDYQELLKRAYDAKFKKDSLFRKAIAATDGKTLTHSIGLQNKEETILTEKEFINMLELLKAKTK
ncbi:hypothetical protein IJC60_05800 [bacterium]|nr:hypothetical protein [bacterium]